jgi:hypothetical protein
MMTKKAYIIALHVIVFGLIFYMHLLINRLHSEKTSIQCPSESSETRDIQVTTYQL